MNLNPLQPEGKDSHQAEERARRLIAMGEMAARLAHEIRNPLGSMELFCTLLKQDLKEQPDTYKLADQIHHAIRKLENVMSNCLQFARDIVPRTKVTESLEYLFDDVIDYATPRATQASVSLKIEEVGEGGVVIDTSLMCQALTNLVLNAVDAAAEKHSQSEIEGRGAVSVLSDRRDSAWWILTVSDNGAGIPEEQQQKIFDPFFTTKDNGTGLGLAIVHSVVSAHDGDISIESDPSTGTSVTVRIPKGQN